MYFSSWRFSVVGGNYYRGLLCGSTRKQTSGLQKIDQARQERNQTDNKKRKRKKKRLPSKQRKTYVGKAI